MDPLIEFTIPVKGLGLGVHKFDYLVDRQFFQHFEGAPIAESQIDLTVVFDKRSDIYIFEFDFSGSIKAECDRCLAPIDLPIQDKQQLLVKFSLEEDLEDAEVVFINPETQSFNVAKYAYEFICLSVPMIKVYDCENDDNRACNQDMLQYLENNQESTEETDNPIWDELKKIIKK